MLQVARRKTRQVKVGDVAIGGDARISVQSMTKTDTGDVEATLSQISRLKDVGCDIVRCAVPDMESAKAFCEIKRGSALPLVADIHFDYRLAVAAATAGADKLRINPGNIGGRDRVAKVAEAAKERGIPIRVGVNSGSIPKDLLSKHSGPTWEALVESAKRSISLLVDEGFEDIVVSLKASDVMTTIRAYRALAGLCDFPLHLGVTEAGGVRAGTVKSSIALGTLLMEGIGDTIRVSLTHEPEEEVKVGIALLSAIGVQTDGVEIISCPTCGRCRGDLMKILEDVEERLKGFRFPIKVAVMGCEVNGPGEAREADVGVALGEKSGLIFREGRPIGRVSSLDIVPRLVEEAIRVGKQKTEEKNPLKSFGELDSSESIRNNTCL
ncbi:MAG: flavodoxin-dependent (E)-4-hydroxy-3-methylbut-2-enyl-diphosphate synthase [Firmicutes bacterium]|nr:flavodoxin-dependent (E)-4-hydroxy-3-methylbut-2-enyl-diphosphate synthase [Bacillota bacterium]